ncbi:MAG: DNA alkylation repair protein [Phycisphaeraceae bacterium]|nr:DNA alkylation repair protein [Phycisphaeraceae bacterium]
MGSDRILSDMVSRFGIITKKAFGVQVGRIKSLAKPIGRDHDLALALWKTEWYEARTLACFVGDPDRLTSAQMDSWCKDFDNWAICDTACFHLFDKSPHSHAKITQWAKSRDEFVKRAAFALLASVALHDKKANDAEFARYLPLIERSATDDRNFVKKGVSWALRLIGSRRPGLKADALALANRLAASDNAAARWIGKDALRDLSRVKPSKKGAVTKKKPTKKRTKRAAK